MARREDVDCSAAHILMIFRQKAIPVQLLEHIRKSPWREAPTHVIERCNCCARSRNQTPNPNPRKCRLVCQPHIQRPAN